MPVEINKIYNQDCIEGLKGLPDNFVNCCVTSPPYYGLRDYGHDDQMGMEPTPELFITNMVAVFTEVNRVLKKEGTLWLNIGDSYASGARNRTPGQASANSTISGSLSTQMQSLKQINKITEGLKPKDLIGIPWMLAFALRSSGWYLRQDIIWHKPNPMPESVTDRCTKAHEYIFLLSKSNKYYYDADAIKQALTASSVERLSQDIENQLGSDRVPGKTNGRMKAVAHKSTVTPGQTAHGKALKRMAGFPEPIFESANKRSVWTVTTKPFFVAHFATFPEDLIVDCIKAGCPESGLVLDPFMGAGTTALVASKLNRNFIGFELNSDYIKIATKRLSDELGMFNKQIV